MKKKISMVFAYLTIFIVFPILFVILNLKYVSAYGEELYLDDTINMYKENDVLFKNSINEIKKESNDIYFDMVDNDISIKVYTNQSEIKNNILMYELKEEELIKYKNTINLMKKLDIKKISKIEGNIEFIYKKLYGNVQCIVYLNEINKYMSDNDVIKIKEIDSLELEEIVYYKETISIDYVIRNDNSV